MSQSQKIMFKKLPMFVLALLLIPCFFIQGYTQTSPTEKTAKAKFNTITIKVQPETSLQVKAGVVVGIFLRTDVVNKQEWRGLLGSKYVIGDVHATDVTPLLWRKLEVQLQKKDGSTAELSMLRPLWWLKLTRAREGGYLELNVPEAGIKGIAKVLKISRCYSDSRDIKDGHNLVISKIKHNNASTIHITFVGSKDTLGVTPGHPLFSLTHSKWIPAGSLKKGDKLKSENGNAAIIRRIQKGKKTTVYNLEVHRAKSYFVGNLKILAHNTGPKCDAINLGGEGEIDNVLNVQMAAYRDTSQLTATGGKTLSELQGEGHRFFFVEPPHNFANLPFADNSFKTIYTNSIPINGGVSPLYGPNLTPSEVHRILESGGEWWHNGFLHFTKP